MASSTLKSHLRMHQLPIRDDAKHLFQTVERPMSLSKASAHYAFGGLSLSLAIQAAFHTLPQDTTTRPSNNFQWSLYSLSCLFLGPLSTAAPVTVEVETLRKTRSFETKLVRLYGAAPGRGNESKKLLSFFATLDFCRPSKHGAHVKTNKTMRYAPVYSQQLRDTLHAGPEAGRSWDENVEQTMSNQRQQAAYKELYERRADLIEMRLEENSFMARTLSGINAQDNTDIHNSPTSKLSERIWMRPRLDDQASLTASGKQADVLEPTCEALSYAQIALSIDPRVIGVYSVGNQLPYGMDHQSVSLEIAIRFHTDLVDAEQWHLYETEIHQEGHGRFYGETRCYHRNGDRVATSTQQAAYRPLPEKIRAKAHERVSRL